MCNIPAFMLATTLISTGMSVYAQKQQQKAEQEQAKFKAAQARAQQDAALSQADVSLEKAVEAEKAKTATGKESERARIAYMSKAKAVTTERQEKFAAQGVYAESDSAYDEVILQQERQRADVLSIYDQFDREAAGYERQAKDFVFEAEQLHKGAQQYAFNARYYDRVSKLENPAQYAATLTAGLGSGVGGYYTMKNA